MPQQNPSAHSSKQHNSNRIEPLSPKGTTMPEQSESKSANDQNRHTETIWRIVIDAISLIILLIVSIISHYEAAPFTRGFFCSDATIKYPYKNDTIPAYAAIILSVGVPIIWIWTTELCKLLYFKRYPETKFEVRLLFWGYKSYRIAPIVRNLYILTVVFGYGYLATWVLIEVTKNFIGELRPHFLAVCQPNIDCTTITLPNPYNSYLQYGTNYTCLNSDTASVREARRSFFSGHTAPLFFGFGYLIMYIHVSWSWRHLGILGHLFQVGLLVLASYVGYTRISDFHHHWHDVFAGAVVGSLIAFVTFKFILNWRRQDPQFLPAITTSTDSCATSSNDPLENMNTYPVRLQEYDGQSAEAGLFHSSDVAVRSRQKILQPISLLKLVFDGLSLAIVLLAWLLLKYLVKPVRRAFLCSDLSLYHVEPQKKVFPTWLLFLCAIGIPLIIILLSEGVRWYYLFRKKSAKLAYELQIRSKIYRIPEWVGNLYIIIGVFIFANCVTAFLTNIGKVTVGRLRPHFIPSCFQKYSYNDFCVNPNDWIVNYVCLGESSSIVKQKDGAYDIRQSFPSGHASAAFCGLIFLALYIHKVWKYRNFGLFPYVMETLCFALAAYIGITRITDNRHHPTDVLGGAILGTFVAIIAFRYMVGSFKRSVLSDLGSESIID
ncbi:unnamed protein product [Rotaria socialis]|uniref:Phosphatidic acid phosphatase type 2/haloperoxidase domain-containing protein n=1 Tax=Rotaria socialis TaxID=392032 RepID=A0A820JLY8_9BILA|nr:unnamed protein product [Rotaria socialis]CAF4329778.1 unnamed protein product [Rotaria socialis]